MFLGIAGLMLGIVGIVLGLRERFAANELKRAMKQIEKAKIIEIWTNIGIVATIFDGLDSAKDMIFKKSNVDHEVLCKVEGARRGSVDLYRLLLKDAAIAEPNFDIDTIERWKNEGKLENEWRVQAAKRLLSAQEKKPIPSCTDTSNGENERPEDQTNECHVIRNTENE